MSKDLTLKPIGPKFLATEDLEPNPHNPRRLFDDADLKELENSIHRVGILVPLTVYQDSKSRKFTILDGQRRWICAQRIGLEQVPVNQVAEPSLVQNIVIMFQIHKLRKDWELMPTALKLQVLMDALQSKGAKTLANLTGLDEAVVVRCKKLLSFPKKFQDMMLRPDPRERVRADFFIELYAVTNDRMVKQFEWYSRNRFTEQMLAKYEARGIKSVTEFRVVKQHISNAVQAKKTASLSKRLREFAEDPTLPTHHLEIPSANTGSQARVIGRAADKLFEQVDHLDTDSYYGEDELWSRLLSLSELIRRKLLLMGRKVSS